MDLQLDSTQFPQFFEKVIKGRYKERLNQDIIEKLA